MPEPMFTPGDEFELEYDGRVRIEEIYRNTNDEVVYTVTYLSQRGNPKSPLSQEILANARKI